MTEKNIDFSKVKILVDMDNVIVNWDEGMLEGLRADYPDMPYLTFERRTIRNIYDQYEQRFGSDVVNALRDVHSKVGFYRNLKPIDGVIFALNEMSKTYDVVICGKIPQGMPDEIKNRILNEKKEWINEYFGQDWAKSAIIIDYNKTKIKRDYLIDDTPDKGDGTQSWTQILFEWPYNKHISNCVSINWRNWKDKLNKKIKDDLENKQTIK